MIGYVGAITDITERRHSEETLRRTLEEKETLLKEIHHRVKNNLQVISSLLRLQSEASRDPAVLAHLAESQDRIRSISLVHETLYQNENLARIDFGDYLRSLTGHLARSYGTTSGGVELLLDVEPVQLDVDTAIPCGLIVTELVSNAFKYAFPAGRTGRLSVTFRHEGSGYLLEVADDGVGLPEGFSWEASTTLGIKLVQALVKQMNGSCRVGNGDKGTVFHVEFSGGKVGSRTS